MGICGVLAYQNIIPKIRDYCKSKQNTQEYFEEINEDQFLYASGEEINFTVTDEKTAILAVQKKAEQLGGKKALQTLSLKNVTCDNEHIFYRLQQNYGGIPVYGRNVVVIVDKAGKVQMMTSNIVEISDVSLKKSLTQQQVNKKVANYIKQKYGKFKEISMPKLTENLLLIYNMGDEDQTELVYQLDVFTEKGIYNIFVSSEDGDIILCRKIENYIQKKFNEQGQLKEQTFVAEAVDADSKYNRMSHRTLSGAWININIPKMNHEYDWFVSGNSEAVVWKDGERADASAVDAITNISEVFEYFYKNFNRNSFSGQGEDVMVYIHTVGYTDSEGEEISSLNNAYYANVDGSPFISITKCYDKDGKSVEENSAHVDIMAHEYMHGIISYTSELSNEDNMSGALNEGISDVLGYCAEADIKNQGIDWTVEGVRSSIQDDSYIFHFDDYNDNTKECHLASTIISHAAYLMSTGNKGTTVRIKIEDLSQLWYKTAVSIPANCSFSAFRVYMDMIAQIMKMSNEQRECIAVAFDSVGIRGNTGQKIELPDETVETYSTELYEVILNEYKEVAEKNFEISSLEKAKYVNSGVWNFIGERKNSVFYRYVDLADDGTPELIISINEKEEPPNIIDIYGINNGLVVRLIEDKNSIGYRSRYYICKDNRIKNVGSGGALDTAICYYRLNGKKHMLELEEEYVYNGWNHATYTHTDENGFTTEISEEKYNYYYSGEDVDFSSEWELLYEGDSVNYVE